jgi:hypothetical protein
MSTPQDTYHHLIERQPLQLDYPHELISEGQKALEALPRVLHDDIDLYEVKVELGAPVTARFSVTDGKTGPVIGDLKLVWTGTRWVNPDEPLSAR